MSPIKEIEKSLLHKAQQNHEQFIRLRKAGRLVEANKYQFSEIAYKDAAHTVMRVWEAYEKEAKR